MTTTSLSLLRAVADGECSEDTQQLDALFPVRNYINQRGAEGYAVTTWNDHSKCWQPVGVWRATEAQARTDRDAMLSLLDMECAA